MNLRGKKDNIIEVQPLTDKTNTINIKTRKKKQENAKSEGKNATKTKPKKARKPPKKSNDENLKPTVVKDCFGFNDSNLYDDGPEFNGELTEFDCSKPYRLALYVKPSKRIRLAPHILEQMQKLNPSLNLTNMTMNSTMARPLSETASSPNRTNFKVPFSSTPIVKPKAKLMQMKITDAFASPKRTRSVNTDQHFKSYFETSGTSEDDVSTPPPAKVAKKKVTDNVSKAAQRKLETDVTTDDTECQPIRRPRRSYVKKPRPEPEPEDTTPTEEVLKSLQKTKKKSKKAEKEEEEFEKWSRSMNSMFDEVEQFEMSVCN